MPKYAVYLETASRVCLAHVPDLPGCVLRAASRDAVVQHLPNAIRDHHTWLRRHGEPAPPQDEPIEFEVAGTVIGMGPFDPGDPAALFQPDHEPVSPEDLEKHLRLMDHSRADLLELVRDLPDDVLEWQADRQSFSINRILRHIGGAEQWYVSRVVDPKSLPPEWENDAELPIFEFLDMERRTAIARLRELTDRERSQIFYPTQWTDHRGEPWTARKVLRRFLEHEREHTLHVRETLVAQRTHLLARLDVERLRLLKQVADLTPEALAEQPVVDDWTVKDVLAHIAAWDRWEVRTLKQLAAGRKPNLTDIEDVHAFNEHAVAASQGWSLEAVRQELEEAREALVDWLHTLPAAEVFRTRTLNGDDWSFPNLLKIQWEHDAEHAAQIAAWREAEAADLEEAS